MKKPSSYDPCPPSQIANAVQGILMRFVACLHEKPDSTGSERDRLTLFLAGAGYMKEAVDHIQHHQARLRQVLKLARNSGYPLTAKWTEMEDLLTTTPGSVYDRVLRRIRHDLAFHFKEDVFLRWIENGDKDPVRLWDIDGTRNASGCIELRQTRLHSIWPKVKRPPIHRSATRLRLFAMPN